MFSHLHSFVLDDDTCTDNGGDADADYIDFGSLQRNLLAMCEKYALYRMVGVSLSVTDLCLYGMSVCLSRSHRDLSVWDEIVRNQCFSVLSSL